MSEDSITLTVDPFLLPTTQHRAGLAGLMVLTETMRRRGMGPLPEIRPDGAGRYLITLTQAALCSALNDLYDATLEERGFPNKLKGSLASGEAREPKRVEKQTDQETGKDKTVYIYDQLVPKGAFLHALGMPSAWIKLWRDAVWSTIRGVPKTRLPFESRRDGRDVEEASRLWLALGNLKEPTLDISSSLLIGAQAVHADNIPFQGRPSETLLLHFWPVVMGVFQPQSLDRDGKSSLDGYVLAIPDVVDFQSFLEDFTDYVAGLSPDMAGFRPKAAVISVPEEGGLEYAAALAAITRARHRESSLHFSTASVEIYHLRKRGNNIPLLHSGRVPVEPGLLHSYEAIRNRYNHPVFRRQLILNLLRGSCWYSGFHDLFSRYPSAWFLGASGGRFQFDFRRKTQLTQEAAPNA